MLPFASANLAKKIRRYNFFVSCRDTKKKNNNNSEAKLNEA